MAVSERRSVAQMVDLLLESALGSIVTVPAVQSSHSVTFDGQSSQEG